MKLMGMKFPLEKNSSGGLKFVSDIDAKSVEIRNCFLTKKGKRPFRPEIGSDFDKVLFTPFGPSRTQKIISMLRSIIKENVSDVIIEEIIVQDDEKNKSTYIEVKFDYFGRLGSSSVNLRGGL